MTLLRQLIIVIITLFALLFAGSVVINVNNTRNYLNNQLRSISQDMATSLGLSLSPHIAKGEMTIVESMINAVSDSGYYREVILSDVNGKVLIKRTQPLTIEGVPQWFVRLIPLETPRGEASIMAGWVQAGHISISANPGYAYATLWGNSVDAFWWFLASSGFAFGLGVIALHYVLRPLRAVEAQAKAICDREYPVQGDIPWTLELRSVVGAMNRMTTKVKDMFEEQAAAMERLRASTYVDSLTGLANRQYFDMQLRQLTKARTSASTNALIFIELDGFKSFNERKGYQAGDALLKGCGALIGEVCKEVPNLDYFIARPSGANFAVVIVDTVEEDALALAEGLGQALIKLRQRGLTDSDRIGHVGVAIHRGQAAGELLSEADMALRAAQVKGPNAVHMSDRRTAGEYASYSASHWLEVLRSVLAERRVVLYRQPCLSCRDQTQVLQYETLMRIFGDGGKLIPANVVIPMAKHLHLTQEFDKHVVNEVLARLGRPEHADLVMAVNLFPMSIQDGGFVAWLAERLRQNAAVASRIAFEVMEHGATDNPDALRGWVERIAETGARTGLDQFGKGFKSFSYLSTLKIDYVKIDGSYTRGIHENKENQFFVDSLVKFAHGLDIQVIAESVETEAEWEMLRNLRVDGVKGYGVGKPEEWL
ncbi:cyclic di-GMP phosphodiesterase Gmr [mine drainage metagenome]|uniref:Cyclic di-GMP phosphodiesterase Gmr n=1 Tax=mine drainage metagenome TaxID=410659 RepID=A0A1J5RB00_9ZZZZ